MPVSRTASELEDLLRRIAADVSDADFTNASLDTRLDSLGMDSLDQLELITGLEDELSVRVPDDKVSDIETIGNLVQLLSELSRG